MVDRLSSPLGEALDTVIEMSPAGRKGKPEEIAKAAVWLCSDEASFVNGHHMVVDGGYIRIRLTKVVNHENYGLL